MRKLTRFSVLRGITESSLGLSRGLNRRLELTGKNKPIICEYIRCFGNEISLSESYKKLTATILIYASEFLGNKKFKEINKDDLILFLNSFRKSETADALHSWISTYNAYLVVLTRFFKWLYHPDMSPKDRHKLKPACVDIASLRRKEQSIYKRFVDTR